MSERIQSNAARLQQKMNTRYSDGLYHKHNKHHLPYRKHCRSHPCKIIEDHFEESPLNGSTGLLRKFNLRKLRKRLDNGRIH